KTEVNSLPVASSSDLVLEKKSASDARTTDGAIGVPPITPSKPIRQPDPPVALEAIADLDPSTDDWTIRAAQLARHLATRDRAFGDDSPGVDWDRKRSKPLGDGHLAVRVVPRSLVGAESRLAWVAYFFARDAPWVRETRIVQPDEGGCRADESQAGGR